MIDSNFLEDLQHNLSKLDSQLLKSGVSVVGHPFAPIGMGEHVRSVFRSLSAVLNNVKIVDIYGPPSTPDAGLISEFSEYVDFNLCKGINIFCINGDEVEQSVATLKDRGWGNGYNIIYPAWELAQYPLEWKLHLNRFNEIWAPSKFIYESLNHAPLSILHHMPISCQVENIGLRSRSFFSIPDSSFAFLFFFDFLSYIERKNPFAVLEAFKLLLKSEPWLDVVLVVKTNNSHRAPNTLNQFMKAVDKIRANVVIIDETLSDADTKSLLRHCDCFVSLHRSEGFGRGMSEAMFLGKPVIATGYSGNMDFCNHDTSFLVDYTLVPLKETEYPHWQNQVWAEPNIMQASEYMWKVASDQTLGRELGMRGRAQISKYFSYRACGLRYLSRMILIN